ncbi:hypothetical protein UA08_04238 [Talaromyces atroroseus]|uniref:Cytochrome P450 n=1 Tax=Talaromyces atroroseus TaxID=1441469 RepID=A0A1Q5Q8J0_TALAT|nr:hypothetical protein UA08_04238 [Talaromyces atroroseus]OKL60382.1 hypothetical protein UA08_04238 [Talaromyces atroroseus]
MNHQTVEAVLLFLCALSIWAWLIKPAIPPLQSLTRGREILHRIYRKQLRDNQVYVLRGVFGNSIVLPPSMLQWLTLQPESHLSAKAAQMDALNIPITFLRPEIGLDPVHEPLIRRNLTANLDSIAGDVWEEVGLALEDLWGQATDSWREVNLDDTVRRVVARAANRVFVGDTLCRDNDYIESSIRFVTRVSICGLLINLFPNWLKRPMGFVFKTPVQMAYSRCAKHLLPVFSDLTLTDPHLFTSWLVSNSVQYPRSSPERTPDFLSRRIMALNFAAIHTSTLTACNLLLDIFSHPPTVSLLRDESLASSARWGKTWKRARFNQMSRLDSALRESLRLWGLVPKAMSRKVMQPDGAILPDGQRLPQGTTVCISGWGLHHDEGIFPQPFEFVHDRFMRAEEEVKEQAEGVKKSAAAETNEHFVAWGIGKHACPGRFFAVDLIKIILAHVLVDYEVKFLGERPGNIWIEYNVLPPPSATLSIRRRV